MFTPPRHPVSDKSEEEFSKPVEFIMRCEDFKSNFARRLSNRYISKSPVSSPKKDSTLKLCPLDNNSKGDRNEKVPDDVPERIEQSFELSKCISDLEKNIATERPPDKMTLKNSDIRSTEVNALNLEVETLRWQLVQTEANRQMHIALIRQIVTFLNRVKEHIQVKNTVPTSKKEMLSANLLPPKPLNFSDLPRSRSVVHVNKNPEYSLTSSKKISTRKISKSISNVNGYKDCSGVWSQPKLSLTPDNECTQKITEEITRLITLASTVLSTKLPDLACTCNGSINETNIVNVKDNNDKEKPPKVAESVNNYNMTEKDVSNYKLNILSNADTYNSVATELFQVKDNNFIIPPSLLTCTLESECIIDKPHEKDEQNTLFTEHGSDTSICKTRKDSIDMRNEIISSNFVEDESGFSSMNSFQEIGIPIISIIPPSPCKEMGYIEDIPNILEESKKWKTDTIDLEKQTVKVFWV